MFILTCSTLKTRLILLTIYCEFGIKEASSLFVYTPPSSRNYLIWPGQVSPDGHVHVCVCVCDDNSTAGESRITRLVMGSLVW